MKKMNERKLLGIQLRVEDIIEILRRTGCTISGTTFDELPDDIRINGSSITNNEAGGTGFVNIVLESEQLDDDFLWKGFVNYHSVRLPLSLCFREPMPPNLEIEGVTEEMKKYPCWRKPENADEPIRI